MVEIHGNFCWALEPCIYVWETCRAWGGSRVSGLQDTYNQQGHAPAPALPAVCHMPTTAPWPLGSPHCPLLVPTVPQQLSSDQEHQGDHHQTLHPPLSQCPPLHWPAPPGWSLKPMPWATSLSREGQSPQHPQPSHQCLGRWREDEQLWVGWKGSPPNPATRICLIRCIRCIRMICSEILACLFSCLPSKTSYLTWPGKGGSW